MTEEQRCGFTLHDSVMVAVDGSAFSDKALEQAIALAKACNSKLFIIHVVYFDVESMSFGPAVEEQLEERGRKILADAKAKAAAAQLNCETFLTLHDQIFRPIVDKAKENNISLIVVGSHGRTGLKKALMGSVSQLVIGHAPCPVLVVPAGH